MNPSRIFILRPVATSLFMLAILLAGIVAGPLTEAGRNNRLFVALAMLALARGLVLVSLNGFSPAVLYHDRYHLSSYVLLGIAGVLGWRHALAWAGSRWPRASTVLLISAILSGSIYLFRAPVSMVDVRGSGENSTVVQARSLKKILKDSARDMLQPPGGGSGGIGYDLAASVLPRDAVVATTVIDPYLLDRRFLQMLPVSENLIDLSEPPEQLLVDLRHHGATHLYLTEFSGLNPWMTTVIDRSLRSLRAIPQLPGVHRLFYLNYSSGKGRQGLYALHQDDAIPLQSEIRNLRLRREPDGTRTVLWNAAPGAEIEVSWLQAPGQKALMGYADSAIGRFPLRLGMPKRYTLEAIVRVKGKPAQRHVLQADPPR